MSANRFSAGKTADCLVYNGLENRSRQVFFRSPFVDQRLNICLSKYTAAGGDRIQSFIIFCIVIQPRSVGLQKRSHLIDKGSGSAGTDTIHTLLYISTFKINNFCIFTAKLDRYICLRSIVLKSSRNSNNFLNKRNTKMLGKGKTAGAGDHRRERKFTEAVICFFQKCRERLLDIGIMAFIIREKKFVFLIQNSNLNGCGTDIDS